MPIRVYKLAKELGLTSKDVMAEALNHGIEVQNHMGSLSEAEANILRAFLFKAPPPEEKKAEPAEPVVEAATEEPAAEPTPEAPAPAATAAEPPAAPREAIELAPVSPPSLGGEAVEPAAAEEKEAPAEISASVSDIAASIVNKSDEPAGAETQAETDAEADEAGEAAAPREAPMISPGSTETVETKSVSPLADREPTRELPRRRQATIVGHKELPREQRPAPSSPDRAAPVMNYDQGMIQTKSVGSKRTFVRAPQRGGGGPGGRYRGRPGGGFGGGRRGGGRGGFQRPQKKSAAKPVERPTSCEIQLPITVKDLSAAMGVKSSAIIEQLIKNHGMFPSINTTLDKDTVELIGLEFECEITVAEEETLEKQFVEGEIEAHEENVEAMEPRAPIITFLGHVDHGKTSLLDYIRESRVAEREHGGITQHIGAWRVSVPTGDVVFLDTPGHQAFTAMRARGANVTDLVVLVVAADDGVMPQTEEAVAHARAADTPIVVAINKIDKPDANVMQVKQQLSGLGLQPEDWGGETVCVEVSALTGQGVDSLLEYLGLVSELLDLKADPTRPAVGTVLEAQQRKGEGNVARVVITDGTLNRGDSFLCGHVFGKVKAIRLPDGKVVNEAGPAWPVELPGLPELPGAGDSLYVVKDVAKARQLAAERQIRMREERLAAKQHTNLENLLKQASTGQLNIILKVDTAGSLEVLRKEILDLKHEEVEPRIIHSGVGGVTETDVTLADASDAVILGFHVTDSSPARKLAEEKGVEIRHYNVIYKLIEELTDALEGKLAPEEREKITGHLEVKKTFRVSRIGTIAGCTVLDGLVRSTARVRVTRDGILVHDGKIASLRHVKDDVKEMKEGQECGLRIDGFDDVKVGDIFEPYEIEQIKRTLSGS